MRSSRIENSAHVLCCCHTLPLHKSEADESSVDKYNLQAYEKIDLKPFFKSLKTDDFMSISSSFVSQQDLSSKPLLMPEKITCSIWPLHIYCSCQTSYLE